MIAIIIGTHGKFSGELLKAAEMILGKQENVVAITFETGEGVDKLVDKYTQALQRLDCTDGVLFMVDLFGGSPFNAASRIVVKEEHMDILTGINLPMLLEVDSLRKKENLADVVAKVEQIGRAGIKSFKNTLQKMSVEEL